ncbi:MAG: hypothetical protein E4H09_01020 [Spirochaetales bacterium]|nr:MAG: hypothetical protein E4H09_01020 [Spirochaetales bacterium]
MKRVVCVIVFVLLVLPLFGQELGMTGTWQLFRLDTIGSFSLNEYRTSPPTSSFVDATLQLGSDGSVVSDSQSLRFVSWAIESRFLSFQTPSGNSFYKVRDLSPDVLFLVSVIVTERNATVTQIEANSNANLVLVRTQ